MLKVREGYTFDDVLLVPKYSEIDSRKNVDLSVDLGKNIRLSIPLISANMRHIASESLALKVAQLGGLAILHRFYDDSVSEQLKIINNIKKENHNFAYNLGVSVGIQDNDYTGVNKFADNGVKVICVDIAHAHSKRCLKLVNYIATKFPEILLIAGNVATKNGAYDLYNNGADVCKVGVGSGSICTTRISAGVGVPQLTALSSVYELVGENNTFKNMKIITDGGAKNSGDLTKGLVFSHAAMIGNLLAGTDEAPGDIIEINGQLYKQYEGSSTFKTNHVEGVKGLVPVRGDVENVIQKLLEGLRSGLSYLGAHNLEELRKDPEFVSITNAGLVESKPHDILVR